MSFSLLFFFNDTATTEIYTLSLHDALPISSATILPVFESYLRTVFCPMYTNPLLSTSMPCPCGASKEPMRSEEHTSELQSRLHLVCRLLLEKKKNENPLRVLVRE